LIVAVATPWFAIQMKDFPSTTTISEVDVAFYWPGLYGTTKYQNSDKTDSDTESWDDFAKIFNDKPKQVYMAAMAFSILALIVTAVSFFFLLFGLIIHSTRHAFERILCGRTKWCTAFILLVSVVFIIISWATFLGFPNALDDSGFCPTSVLGRDGIVIPGLNNAWCSTFIGNTDEEFLGVKLVTFVWGPFGWIFTVVATVWALIALVLTIIVRPWDYERVN